MKAPFPYFGGKSSVAPVIWAALGQPKHYIEPFFGSGAVLLSRPDYNPAKHMETICDKDGFVANVWRALQLDPDAVAKVCDWPVNHADLMARRRVLIKNTDHLLENLIKDDEWFDAKMAGYWIWAASCWIGSGLTRPNAVPELVQNKGINGQIPELYSDNGINASNRRPEVTNNHGCHNLLEGRPHVDNGQGVNQLHLFTGKRPALGNDGIGINQIGIKQAPGLDVRDPYTPGLYDWFRQLSERLRRVRVVCGDWSRVCGGDWQDDRGTCGIFFDPTYGTKARRKANIYAEDSLTVADDVREWCRKRADRKSYRIVLAGYYEEHTSLLDEGWTVYRWSAHGGYANKGKGATPGKANRHREALFFSPHCHSSGLKRFETADVLEEVPA
jgi:site-specific DNA-adenine methylase